MTEEAIIDEVELELMDLSTEFEAAHYALAYDQAVDETGFTCDDTDVFKLKWLKERMKRWLFSYKYNSSMDNFNVPKASLNQIVVNYKERLKDMDDEYQLAQLENPDKFGLADTKGAMFGTVVGSGFLNDKLTGEDITYESTGNVLVNGKNS